MGTRSLIARPSEGGGFTGVYVHWDGYPTHQVRELHRIVTATFAGDAIKARDAILAKSWSSLTDPNLISATQAEQYAQPGYEIVAGVGVAHDGVELVQSTEPHLWAFEWAYVIDAKGVRVLEPEVAADQVHSIWNERGVVRWDQPFSPEQAVQIECGENWVRCKHMAYAHDPKAQALPYNMREWIGQVPADSAGNATKIVVNGRRRNLSGGYSQNRKARTGYLAGKRHTEVTLFSIVDDQAVLTYDHILPPTKTLGERILPAGSTVPI